MGEEGVRDVRLCVQGSRRPSGTFPSQHVRSVPLAQCTLDGYAPPRTRLVPYYPTGTLLADVDSHVLEDIGAIDQITNAAKAIRAWVKRNVGRRELGLVRTFGQHSAHSSSSLRQVPPSKAIDYPVQGIRGLYTRKLGDGRMEGRDSSLRPLNT